MTYDILRIIIGVITWNILIFIGIKILAKNNKSSNKYNLITAIIVTILTFIVISLPLGQWNRFKTLEGAFKYYFPKATIVKRYGGDSYAFIYYEQRSYDKHSRSADFVYFIRDKRGWNLGRTDILHYGYDKSVIQKDHSVIVINRLKKEQVTGVYIFSTIFNHPQEKNNPNVVTDSYSTDFEVVADYVTYAYVGIIDEYVDDDYTIILNDKKYQPLK